MRELYTTYRGVRIKKSYDLPSYGTNKKQGLNQINCIGERDNFGVVRNQTLLEALRPCLDGNFEMISRKVDDYGNFHYIAKSIPRRTANKLYTEEVMNRVVTIYEIIGGAEYHINNISMDYFLGSRLYFHKIINLHLRTKSANKLSVEYIKEVLKRQEDYERVDKCDYWILRRLRSTGFSEEAIAKLAVDYLLNKIDLFNYTQNIHSNKYSVEQYAEKFRKDVSKGFCVEANRSKHFYENWSTGKDKLNTSRLNQLFRDVYSRGIEKLYKLFNSASEEVKSDYFYGYSNKIHRAVRLKKKYFMKYRRELLLICSYLTKDEKVTNDIKGYIESDFLSELKDSLAIFKSNSIDSNSDIFTQDLRSVLNKNNLLQAMENYYF